MDGAVGTRDEVFGFLRSSWLAGKPIVPLLGAGISVGSAIPVTQHLVDYLIKVKCLSQLEKWDDCSEYLRFRGWPSRHQLNIDLVARTEKSGDLSKRLRQAKHHLITEALTSQLGPRQPTVRELLLLLGDTRDELVRDRPPWAALLQVPWAALLQVMTDRRQSLVDSFYDRLVRDRHPSAAHRFLACLTKLVGWNLVLTTNFDDLVETALRDEGLPPVVYELLSNGVMPDPLLVESHLAVIKMNGGAFDLRAGFELDEPLDPQSVAFFHRYLPKDVILLVLGYSGTERRVMSILESLAEEFDEPRRIVWVNPSPDCPKDPSKHLNKAIWRLRHSDAGLFLQELYERLTFSHAVGAQPYDVLHHLPDVAADPPEGRSRKQLFVRNARENELRSSLLAQYLEPDADEGDAESPDEDSGVTPPFEKIWFNLYELPSLATFLDLLIEKLRRRDRSLPPLILSPAVDFPELPGSDHEELKPRRIRWYRYLATALRRYKYLIAIDGVRAFSNDHPAAYLALTTSAAKKALATDIHRREAARREHLYTFLREFGDFLRSHPLGGSRIIVALDSHEASRGADLEDGAEIRYVRRQKSESGSVSTKVTKQYDVLHKLGKVHLKLGAVAVSFRRPRSRVALVRITAKALAKVKLARPARYRSTRRDVRDLDRVVGDDWAQLYAQIEWAISDLSEAGFFIEQDGGAYCMDTDLRNNLFDHFVNVDSDAMKEIQSLIADYYRVDAYQQSQDLTAYLEYVFHRLASTELAGRAGGVRTPETWLIASLEREGELLTGRGYASAVIASLDDFSARCRIVGNPDSRQWVTTRLTEMRVAVWQDLTSYQELIGHHLGVAREQLKFLHRAEGTNRIDAGLTLAEAMMELASSANRQQLDEPNHRTNRGELGKLVSDVRVTLQLKETPVAQSDHIPRSLAEGAFGIVEQCRERAAAAPEDLATRKDLVKRLWRLEVSCLRALIDYRTREVNPWRRGRGGSSAALERSWKTLQGYYDRGIDVLRAQAHGEQGLEAQCRLRCAKARGLYLLGKFGHADQELNRAQAFAARAQGWDAPITQAICWLYRAEHCLLHGRSIREKSGRPKRKSLFNAAENALAQAEELLLPARRDVFWSCRLFILKAQLECERLRLMVAAVGVVPQPEAERVKAEATLLSALHAVAAGLANVHDNRRRRTRLDDLWDDLEDLHRSLSRSERDSKTEERWREYNVRSGLDFYYRERRPVPEPQRNRILVVEDGLLAAQSVPRAVGRPLVHRPSPMHAPGPAGAPAATQARKRGASPT